jgi:hypothetical protein
VGATIGNKSMSEGRMPMPSSSFQTDDRSKLTEDCLRCPHSPEQFPNIFTDPHPASVSTALHPGSSEQL